MLRPGQIIVTRLCQGWPAIVLAVALVVALPAATAPSIDRPDDLIIAEDASSRTVELSGLAAGDSGGPLRLSASSADPDLIGDPAVGAIAGDGSASLSLTPVSDANGSTTITVTVSDAGASTTVTFAVTVEAVNDPPTIDAVAGLALQEDAGEQIVDLTGIAAGPANESQSLTVTVASADLDLIEAPTINYAPGASTAELRLTPVADASGSTTVAVTLVDSGGGDDTTVLLIPVTVSADNDEPTVAVQETLSVVIGGSATLSSSVLTIADDGPAGALVLTLAVPPTRGQLRLDGVGLLADDSFTQADIDAGRVTYQHSAADDTADEVTLSADDGEGGTLAGIVVAIAPTSAAANQAPVVTLASVEAAWTEGAAGLAALAGASVSDAENSLGNGSISIALSGGDDGDRLRLVSDSSVSISVSGDQVSHGGLLLGSWTAGDETVPLTVSLSGSATPTQVADLLAALRFDHQGDDPSATDRDLQVVVDDGLASSDPVAMSIQVTPVNDAPVASLPVVAITYQEGAGSQVLDPTARLSDADSATLTGGGASLSIASGGTAADILIVVGDIELGITVVDGQVIRAERSLATVIDGDATTPLQLRWASGATIADAQAVLRQLAYRNDSDNPVATTRTLSLVVDDGDGGSSDPAGMTVTLVPVDDPPVVTPSTGTVAFVEDGGAVLVDTGLLVEDIDSADFAGGRLTLSLGGAGLHEDDRIGIADGNADGQAVALVAGAVQVDGATIAQVSGFGAVDEPWFWDLQVAATPATVQAALRRLVFFNDDGRPGEGARQLSVTVDDGDGAASVAVSWNVAVTDINLLPVLTPAGDVRYLTEDDPATLVTPAITITDADSPDLGAGQLRVAFADGMRASDHLSLVAEGSGDGQVGRDGSEVLYGGVPVATLSEAVGAALTVDFSSGVGPSIAQAIARRIAVTSDEQDPDGVERSLVYELDDGDGGTGTAAVGIVLVPVNDPPVIDPVAVLGTVSRDWATVTAEIRLSLTDVDDTVHSWSITTPPLQGTAAFVGDGSGRLRFTAAEGQRGDDQLQVVADDGSDTSAPVVVPIRVTGRDDRRPHALAELPFIADAELGWTGTVRVDGSELDGLLDCRFQLVEHIPAGLTLTATGADSAELVWPIPGIAGHHPIGVLFTDRSSGASGLQRLLVRVVGSPGGDG